MAVLKPLFKPTTKGPVSTAKDRIPFQTLLINNFQHTSWLLVGGLLQGLLTWAFPTVLTLLPAVLILLYRGLDVLLIMGGFRKNPYMHDAILQKFSAQFPDENGNFGEKPSQKKVVVLLLGSRSNHPLGVLYPQYLKVAQYFQSMMKDLEEKREEYGYITSNSYLSNADPTRNAARDLVTVYYFESMEGLHKFAHGPIHRAGWDWWHRTAKEHPDISIMHEVYEAPAGSWETIYMNYHRIGFSGALFPIESELSDAAAEKEGEASPKLWTSGIVDASRANMKSSGLRMSRA